MSLPDTFLDELRSRLSLAQVVGRKVSWDQRRSNRAKGDWWAPCPFHEEKTASFHVDDRKGFFHCFGCGAKGDAIAFVRQSENVGFMEAIEILAREAGIALPARDPREAERAGRQAQLAEVMEKAVRHYRLQLRSGAAAEARAYLARRGLAEAEIERWEIGFAPGAPQGLLAALEQAGIAPALAEAAGLCGSRDGGRYDFFRDRIMFPIRDARGRAIAFGGRAMRADAKAKYLNSPETELFHKKASLFNHGPAREAAGRGQALVVVEGYMDVIALGQAGVEAAVAPLGTALTEQQLQLMWRISPEPVIALDGDAAGLRAAMRVIDLALPQLAPDRSLRFCLMPPGQDPDDLLRAEGAAALRARLGETVPLVRLLWQRETEGQSFDSPERRAALDRRLREALARIEDAELRRHYWSEVAGLRRELFGARRAERSPPPRRGAPQGAGRRWRAVPGEAAPLAATRGSAVASGGARAGESLREAVILATLLRHPALVPRFETEIERLDLVLPLHRTIRDALLAGPEEGACERALKAAGDGAIDGLLAQPHVRIAPGVRGADADLAAIALEEDLSRLAALRGIEREIGEAEHDLAAAADEGLTWRLGQAAAALARAGRLAETGIEFDTAPNGARLNRAERDSFDALIDGIDFGKGRRGPA